MKKYTDIEYQIFENIAQAKSILRKNNGSQEDDDFQKIIGATNKDGWTGLLTRLVYKDGVDVDEVISFYPDLKKSKMDLGKLNKMSYDDIIDLLYQDSNNPDKIDFVGRVGNYLIFHIKEYEEGLKICSPAWCLKTKLHWDQYVTSSSAQFVVIQENYVNKSGRTKLLTPNSTAYMGSYGNERNPNIRYGITYYFKPKDTFEIFNDNNDTVNLKHSNKKDLELILDEIKKYTEDEGLIKIKRKRKIENLDDPYTVIKNILKEAIIGNDPNSFDYDISESIGHAMYHREMLDIFDEVNEILKEEMDTSLKEWWNEYTDRILNDSDLIHSDGLTDYILYYMTGGNSIDETPNHPLSGVFLNERELTDHCYKFMYGYHFNKYGKMMILQSYDTIADWFIYIFKNFASIFFEEPAQTAYDVETIEWYNKLYKEFSRYGKENSINIFIEKFISYNNLSLLNNGVRSMIDTDALSYYLRCLVKQIELSDIPDIIRNDDFDSLVISTRDYIYNANETGIEINYEIEKITNKMVNELFIAVCDRLAKGLVGVVDYKIEGKFFKIYFKFNLN
jgi:hypothetical protein